MKVAAMMKRVLHAYGIHSTTIQPEFIDVTTLKVRFFGYVPHCVEMLVQRKHEKCQLSCKVACVTDACCPPSVQEAYRDQEIEALLSFTESDNYTRRMRRISKQNNE